MVSGATIGTVLGMAYRNRGLIRKAGNQIGGAYKRYRGRAANRASASAPRNPGVNTYQNDATIIQSARRRGGRSLRKAKSFKRFRNKVRAVQSADVPNSSVVRQSFRALAVPTGGTVANGTAAQRSVDLGFGDSGGVLAQIFTASGLSATVGSEDTLALRGGACEIQIANYTNASFLDVYELVARKDISTAQDAAPATEWGAAYNALANAGGAPTIDTWGVTPFEAPAFCKMWKIIRTTRLQMSAGQVVTIERTVKTGSRRVTGNQVASTRYLKGMRAFLFVSKGIPSSVGGGAVGTTSVKINYNQTWHYEVFEPSEAQRSLIPTPP